MSFALALGLGLVLTPVLARLGILAGLVDRPADDGLKVHSAPKPLTGGIGIVLAVLVSSAAAGDPVGPWPLSAVVLLLTVGIADDVLMLPPILRLGAQIVAGALLAAGGATFGPLGDLGPITVVVAVAALANAVNMMDGQDGLAGGLAAVAGLGLAAIVATQGHVDAVALSLIGALIGFLFWNRPPATVFLGDGGAYAIGCFLALLATRSVESSASLLGTLLCLGVFAFEMISTVLRRAVGRSSPFSGDRAHVYDLLAERLSSRPLATAGMWSAGLVATALGWAVAEAPLPAGILVTVVATLTGSAAVVALWKMPGTELRRSG